MAAQILPLAALQSTNVGNLHASSDTPEVFVGTEGVYFLPHNLVEIERLQRQHRFLKTATDDKLIPDALPSGSKVLDSGCADGTWLLELASQNPERLHLQGVDLNDTLFQAQPSLDLRVQDIREPFPADWQWKNAFDLVHQRLLVWGIAGAEWPAVIHHLSDVVKPGGYIQLVEAEWILADVSDRRPEQKKLHLVQEWSASSFGMDVHIWDKLDDLLRAEGFEDINISSFDLGYGKTAKHEEDRTRSAELWAESFRHIARKIPTTGIPGVAQDAAEYHEFLDRLVVEMKTVGYTPKLKWVRARKPLA
ncbi:MAG: hypothetical protein M4579_005137 [Chaenotheca gracillima]|nr:MAG: hypothetical protein M4579_005137 [Chaenotheca gracillima]